jgi:hypothetical protein
MGKGAQRPPCATGRSPSRTRRVLTPFGWGALAYLVGMILLGLVPSVVAWIGYGLALAAGGCLAVLLLALVLTLWEERGRA